MFRTLLMRMRAQRAHVGSNEFVGDITRALPLRLVVGAISVQDVVTFFQECGYYK